MSKPRSLSQRARRPSMESAMNLRSVLTIDFALTDALTFCLQCGDNRKGTGNTASHKNLNPFFPFRHSSFVSYSEPLRLCGSPCFRYDSSDMGEKKEGHGIHQRPSHCINSSLSQLYILHLTSSIFLLVVAQPEEPAATHASQRCCDISAYPSRLEQSFP